MLRGIIRKVPGPGKTPFPVPDFPLVPFVPILVILRGKNRYCDFFPKPNPPRFLGSFFPQYKNRLLYCSMRLVCFASPCYARTNSKRLPSSDGILCCRKQLPAALAAFSTSLNLALALCLSSQTMSYLSHTFLTLD